MTDDSNIGTMLAVAGLFAITFYLLRDPVGDAESAIIAAAGCTGLTGATLAACQKAQPKPKLVPKTTRIVPGPITPATPKPKSKPLLKSRFNTPNLSRPINLQRLYDPQRRITASRSVQEQKFCNDTNGTWRFGRCVLPITPTDKRAECQKKAEMAYLAARFNAYYQLATQNGVTVEYLMDNTATHVGMQYSILRKKYNDLVRVLEDRCRRAVGLKEPSVNWDKGGGFGPPSTGHTPSDPSSATYRQEYAV